MSSEAHSMTMDELVGKLAELPVERLAQTIAAQAAVLGSSAAWDSRTHDRLIAQVRNVVELAGLPAVDHPSELKFWRALVEQSPDW